LKSATATIGFVAILVGAALPAANVSGQSPLQASFTANLPFGPFGQDQAIVVRAMITNTSSTQTIFICSGVCVGDAGTYSLSSETSTPDGYTFYSGDDPEANTDAFDGQLVGALAPGETKQFIYGVYTPISTVSPGTYPFNTEIRTFAATPERPLLRTDGFGGAWAVTALPVYSCEGFQSPFDVQLSIGPHTKKRIPLSAQLFDGTGLVGASSIDVSPIAEVQLLSETGPANDDAELVVARKPRDGLKFEFDARTGNWTLNLSTREYMMPGIYIVTMQSGDPNSYFISPRCVGTFVRQ